MNDNPSLGIVGADLLVTADHHLPPPRGKPPVQAAVSEMTAEQLGPFKALGLERTIQTQDIRESRPDSSWIGTLQESRGGFPLGGASVGAIAILMDQRDDSERQTLDL